MAYDIDFLAVENEKRDGTKSGDAIILNFADASDGTQRRVIVDAGFSTTGSRSVNRFVQWYQSTTVDLVISTHPDSDHINGLIAVLEELDVAELMLHLPWLHHGDARELGNYEKIRELYDVAERKGTRIVEPFAGLTRFGGALSILGPSREYYEDLLSAAIDEVRSGAAGRRVVQSKMSALLAAGKRLLERAIGFYPAETLGDVDDTSPRNQASVITLISQQSKRMMLTGDAGIGALAAAADLYVQTVGEFHEKPLHFFQAPHHGSKHNLGSEILNRILGPIASPHARTFAFISSAKASDKHPSPKVTNALGRRNAVVLATEGMDIHIGDSERLGYTACTPIGPLVEEEAS